MNKQDKRIGRLPANINKVNPSPGADALSITGLLKESGKISGYQLSNGQKVDRANAVQMAKNNQLKGVAVAVNQGTEYLRGLPDASAQNNLGNLPTVSDQ